MGGCFVASTLDSRCGALGSAPRFPAGNGMTKTEKLLRELIALPSVNPAFLPARHPRAGEQRVAEFLAATAAQAGLEVEFQPVAHGPLESAGAPLAPGQGRGNGSCWRRTWIR